MLGIFAGFTTLGQTRLDAVDSAKINLPKVTTYLQHQMENGIEFFKELKPSLKPGEPTENYHTVVREFLIKDNINEVWNTYIQTGLQEAWNTRKINYGFSYSRDADSLFYADDMHCQLVPGLIVFLNLKMLFGTKNMAMAFEVTRIDSVRKVLEFSYIEGNETEGNQQLIFESTAKGHTLITHLSNYKSRIKPRDLLYPLVHAQIIGRFHRNMKEIYRARNKN